MSTRSPYPMPERGQRLESAAVVPPPVSVPPPSPPPPGGHPPQVIRPTGRGHHVSTRRFEVHRDRDVSGVSGTGVVADGVRWPDGSVSIRWRGDRPSVVFWHSLDDAEQVHGHGGATRFVWLDPDPTVPAGPLPVVKLPPWMPLAEGTCEACGHPLEYNLSANWIWHADPAQNDRCDKPFPAIRPKNERQDVDPQ